jgi:hypothetical protein
LAVVQNSYQDLARRISVTASLINRLEIRADTRATSPWNPPSLEKQKSGRTGCEKASAPPGFVAKVGSVAKLSSLLKKLGSSVEDC